MRRSLASQVRVKTAHHLLNIVALNREIETYNVDGLLKAASVGQSKESCLRYAGLHAALLIEKRALASIDGPVTKPQGNFNFGPSAPAAKPPAARSGAPKPTQMSGFGAPSALQLKPTASPSSGGGYTGGNYMINTQATKPSTAPSNLDRGFFGAIADSQKTDVSTGVPGVSLAAPASPPPALNNEGTATRRQAPTPLTANVIPKPAQGTANATSGLGYDPTGSGSAGRVSGTKPAPTRPQNDMTSPKFKPTADTVDPVEEEYSRKLNEGAAADAKSRATANMPSLAASSAGEGGVPAAQEAIAAQSQGNGRSGRFFNGQGIGQGLQNRGRLLGGRGR